MDKLLQLNEFFVEGGHQEISHVLLNLIQPTNEKEEKEKGYFFAICEINHGNIQQITELQRIMGEIENGYYETNDTKDKNALEIVLEKINSQNLALFSLNLSLNCVIGAIKSNEIIFSYCGKPNIVLFYAGKEKIYKKMDLTENEDEEVDEGKTLFSQMVTGKVSPGDFFFIGTKKITEYFNHDRLQKIITTRDPQQSTEHIRRVLSELKNGLSFGGLIINLKEKYAVEKAPEKKNPFFPKNPEKVNSLFLMEQKTANTLSPSLFSDWGNKIKNKTSFLKFSEKKSVPEKISQNTDTQINSAHLKQRLSDKINKESLEKIAKVIGKYLWVAVKHFGKALWWLFLLFAAILASLFKTLKEIFFYLINYKGQRRQIKERWSQAIYSYKQNFKHLPLMTKILGLMSLVVLTIFIASLFYLQHSKKIQKENLYYEQTFSLLEEKIEEAESLIIYTDQNTMVSLKNEIKNILDSLKCRETDEATCRIIKENYNKLEKKIQKFVENPNISMLVNWNILGCAEATKFTKVDGRLLGVSPGGNSLCVYNLLTKDGTATLKIPGDSGAALTFSFRDEKSSLFFTANNNLYRYSSEQNSFEKMTTSFPEQNYNLKDFLTYGSRLYTLDTLNNQIYRHDAILSGYGLGKEWVKSKEVDIKKGVSFAIDGDLYLLKEQGEILKFNAGELQTFAVSGVEPTLQNGTKIWTYSEDKQIYILDNVEKRLVVLNKDGTLKNQYTSDQFENPTDMIIEEKNKTAYILDKGRVYQIELK